MLIGTYLLLLAFTSMPSMQRWMAHKVGQTLSEELETEVKVGNVRIGLFNRVVLDDILIKDLQSDTLLSAARLSAKLNWYPLTEGRIELSHVLLFGYDIRLRKQQQDTPYNVQFLLDKISSKDSTEHTPLNLAFSTILIRRGTFSHEVDYEPSSDLFNWKHLRLQDLSIKVSKLILSDDSVSVDFKHLSFIESSSGLTLEDLDFCLYGNREQLSIDDFSLKLSSSEINIPNLILQQNATSKNRSEGLDGLFAMGEPTFQGKFIADITPCDLAPLLPQLQSFRQNIHLSTSTNYDHHTLHVQQLAINGEGVDAACEAWLRTSPEKGLQAELYHLSISSSLTEQVLHLMTMPEGKSILSQSTASTILQAGDIHLKGKLSVIPHGQTMSASADINVTSSTIGQATIKGTMTDSNDLDLHVETAELALSELLPEIPLNHITLQSDITGSLQSKSFQLKATLDNFVIKDQDFNHLDLQADLTPNTLNASLNASDPQCSFTLLTNLHAPQAFELNAQGLEAIEGRFILDNLRTAFPKFHYKLNEFTALVNNDQEGHHIELDGDFIDADINGRFTYNTLVSTAQQIMHQVLPSLVPSPSTLPTNHQDHIDFSLRVWNADSLLQMVNNDLHLPQACYVIGQMNGKEKTLKLQADFPHIAIGNEDLRHVAFKSSISQTQTEKTEENTGQPIMDAVLSVQRMMESGPIDFTLTIGATNDNMQAEVLWDDHGQSALTGSLSTNTRFFKGERNQLGADIHIEPTQISVADTVWNVHKATLRLHNNVVDVNNVTISHIGRHLQLNGRIGSEVTDTLFADLKGINLQYVFGLLDFHSVEFAGLATGRVQALNLMDKPIVNAGLQIHDFTLNDGLLGELNVTGGWGRKGSASIDLDAFITEPTQHRLSHVVGLVTPGHGPDSGLDLDIQAQRINVYFINDFTSSFFTDVQGMATGHARLYGPFDQLDLEGDVCIDTAAVTIDVLGTRYHLTGDTLHLRPGRFYTEHATIFDKHHGHDRRMHQAIVAGEVLHDHFDNIHFNFDMDANEILGYDFQDFGDQLFYGTVFASGHVGLAGQPGRIVVNLEGTPTAGTVFTYNASSPVATTNNSFINFINHDHLQNEYTETTDSALNVPLVQDESQRESDIFINFNVNVTPESTIRLLMDARSDDYITLYGNGQIRANYHNNGKFQMYGTYRVDHGTYKLSLQDVIRKDFQFERDGTIIFGGAPMKADLNLRAIYTVPSVSLNDLAVGSNFSNSSVRVNCLMNIGGRAEQPIVNFDFDIPNVNEDEKRMVRALISTEEERNLQVVYLLGIGRFYTYGLNADQSQTDIAMNSLLSSTLSGQLNNILSSALGSSANNWNFGTNLSTGNTGWSDMDVEGMLSGRLLNNRLLVNGTFGYRDTPVANTNFIGDFDVKWLLTPSGNISLKAYSETNDRYFTKSALTTQGIGIQVRKDFNNLSELFTSRKAWWKKKRKKK